MRRADADQLLREVRDRRVTPRVLPRRMTADELIQDLETWGGFSGYARARGFSKQRAHQLFRQYCPGYVEVWVERVRCAAPDCLEPRYRYALWTGNRARFCVAHLRAIRRTTCATPWCRSPEGRSVRMCHGCKNLLAARRRQGWIGTDEEIRAVPPVARGRNPASTAPNAAWRRSAGPPATTSVQRST